MPWIEDPVQEFYARHIGRLPLPRSPGGDSLFQQPLRPRMEAADFLADGAGSPAAVVAALTGLWREEHLVVDEDIVAALVQLFTALADDAPIEEKGVAAFSYALY